MEAPKYRKRPVVIEAMRLDDFNGEEVAKWCGRKYFFDSKRILINTLEGVMTARVGDYIIKGVQGEYYPCKPEIFEATYERI